MVLPQEAINGHDLHPACWFNYTSSESWLLVDVANWQQRYDRILDIATRDTRSPYAYFTITGVCGVNDPQSSHPLKRDWGVDIGVTQAQAVARANATGMAIVAVAPIVSSQGQVVFVSLREKLPVGYVWQWIPATDPLGIQAWLQANPTWKPYSVDCIEMPGATQYQVMALSSGTRSVRNRRIVFQAAFGNLPLPASPCGERVASMAQDGAATFAAVMERPLSGEITDYAHAIPVGRVPTDVHGQMERGFAHSFRTQPNAENFGTGVHLVTANAWSLYDVIHWPSRQNDYRGCDVGALGPARLSVGSTAPSGEAEPGHSLLLAVAPSNFGSLVGAVAIGLDRHRWTDLTPFGAPGCLAIPGLDLVLPVPANGLLTPLPPTPCLRGARFYMQGIVLDPLRSNNALGVSTSNFYMITVR